MNGVVASRINGGNTAYKRVQSDFYPTPADATKALLNFLNLPKGTIVWEPACGEGHMADEMEKCGLGVKRTDIQTGYDFLQMPFLECDWIITNPPFSIADKFIERCIEHNRPFALLLKSQYWHAKKRLALFYKSRPTHILPLTWRPDFLFKTRGSGSPLMDVMWVVWDIEYNSSPYPVYIPLERPKEV